MDALRDEFLGDPEPAAASSRVTLNLAFCRAYQATDGTQSRSRIERHIWQTRIGGVTTGFASDESLDDSVLEGVEADHDKAAASSQIDDTLIQYAFERR